MTKLFIPIKIGILLYPSASPALALVMRDVFKTANEVMNEPRYETYFISVKGGTIDFGDLSIKTIKAKQAYDILLVVPYSLPLENSLNDLKNEAKLIESFHAEKIKIAAPCLGSMVLAQSGILDGLVATTHWGIIEEAKKLYPNVKWNSKEMICRSGSVTTAGGYLGAVDLVLSILADTSGKKVAHNIGRLLLAESSREKQSVYASSLISQKDHTSPFYALDFWVVENLEKQITIPMMAEFSNMSLRNFQRQFSEVYGLSPKAFLQLKRVEKAKVLLRDTRLSVEEIVEKIGLTDVSSFRKLFQRELGITPAEFRKRIM
jgi:transcriptional regulator GlxA family with amidase domain